MLLFGFGVLVLEGGEGFVLGWELGLELVSAVLGLELLELETGAFLALGLEEV